MKIPLLRLGLAVGVFASLSGHVLGQNPQPCRAHELARSNAARFPELAAQRADFQASIADVAQQFLQKMAAENRSTATIPVVVHIVYRTLAENISDAQVQSQIAVLNADFRKKNANIGTVPPEFAPFAADVELEFCLAAVAPDGKPTNGITRRATSHNQIGRALAPNGLPRVCYASLGGEDAWDATRYLNIWVANLGEDVLGYATFPGTVAPAEDGVFIDPRFFGKIGSAAQSSPHHLGRTATHEIGHFFDLYHLWGEDGDECADDDGVGDTPPQAAPFEGCPTHPQQGCGGHHAMFMNYMDYASDACMALFTHGQKARIWGALQVARPGLLTSDACSPASGLQEAAAGKLTVFPNPARERLHLWLPGNAVSEPEITDALGRRHMVSMIARPNEPLEIGLENLPAGWFVVKIATTSGQRAAAFCKQ